MNQKVCFQNIDDFTRFKLSDYGTAELVMTAIIPVFALFLLWYSKKAIKRHWIV